MTELRWREVFVQMGEGYGRTEKVLQYRERREGYPKEWIAGQNPPIVVEWTEWQDVPTVQATR